MFDLVLDSARRAIANSRSESRLTQATTFALTVSVCASSTIFRSACVRDRSGHVEAGGNFGAARKHKSGHGCISDSTSSMNCSISATAASGRRTVFSVGGALRGGQIGTNIEQATLAQVQDGMHPSEEALVVGGKAHGQANGGVGSSTVP